MKKNLFFFIIPIFTLCQDFYSNLPIIVINTYGNTILDDPRIISNMGIIHNPGSLNYLSDQYNNYNGQISIELRGSSSQDIFPKKSYSLETQTKDGDNNNISLLGMPEENDWILYGPYSDKTLMRNNLAYEISKQMGYYSPRTKYCELFINDEYKGVYLLTEKIKRDINRVNIGEFDNQDPASGGYIIKIDKFTDAPDNASWCSNILNFNKDNVCFQYHYPKADDIKTGQKIYIENFINEVNSLLIELIENQSEIDLVDKIDFKSFIDYFIISELSKDVDAYRISVFLHKDSEINNGKLRLGPIWDYNLSFGNVDFCQSSNINGWVIEQETSCISSVPTFWRDLLKNDSYRNSLIKRWEELRLNELSIDKIYNHIDSLSQYLENAQKRNFQRWDILNEWIWPNYQIGLSYEDEVDYLKYWISRRINWIDENIQDLKLMFPDCTSKDKSLVKITNMLGQSFNNGNDRILFYIYDNGCVEKKLFTF